jgi:dihydroorotate dehydrogenase electron transfer subunit
MYTKCTVKENKLFSNGFGRIMFDAGEIAKASTPGQFVMVKCWQGNVPFLPRPFSINNADRQNGSLEILYKIVGKGSKLLSELSTGDSAMIHGPLGNGFVIPEDAGRIAVVGRGVGAAPMLYLAAEAIRKSVEVYAFLSASREDLIFDKDKYTKLGAKVFSTCDNNVLVTDYLVEQLQDKKFDAVYTCGSKRLMREIKRLKDIHGFDAYVSLEEHMACGIGACKGCICTTYKDDGSTQYERVCKEGPVFPVERLVK